MESQCHPSPILAADVNIGKAFSERIISVVSPDTMAQLGMIEGTMVGLKLPIEVTRAWLDALKIGTDIALAVTALARFSGRI